MFFVGLLLGLTFGNCLATVWQLFGSCRQLLGNCLATVWKGICGVRIYAGRVSSRVLAGLHFKSEADGLRALRSGSIDTLQSVQLSLWLAILK